MMDEKDESGLSAAETAYFESGGETPLVTEQGTQDQGNEQGQESLQAEAEGVEGSDAEGQERDDKGRFTGKNAMVPHSVFHAEREEHKRTKAEIAELREFKARMEERWRLIDTAAQAQQQQQPVDDDPEPDRNQDIFAHNEWLARQLKKTNERVAQDQKARQEAEEAKQIEAGIRNEWFSSAATEKAENPEFAEAVTWLHNRRATELKTLGKVNPALANLRSDQGVINQINNELREIIISAKRSGQSPAKMVYMLAKELGFQPAQQQQQASQGVKMPGSLANIQKAQEASRTIGAASGAVSGDDLSLEQIMAMSPTEFQNWHADPKNARRFDNLMGA